MQSDSPVSCSLFCQVIDNFGDIGVCWRLARQLHQQYGWQVRLWVDDLNTFSQLAPGLHQHGDCQQLDGLTVMHWHDSHPLVRQPDFTGDVIIEGFGCRLPPAWVTAMRQQPPVWINLEYLGTEDWVDHTHGLPSIHPATGLQQTFWIPSPRPGAGGLLREPYLPLARSQVSGKMPDFLPGPAPDTGIINERSLHLSLFAYENPQITALLDAASTHSGPVAMYIPRSRATTVVTGWLGRHHPQAAHDFSQGQVIRHGALQLVPLPFLQHSQYDQLLAFCDANLVRGEDSWTRAQWAKKPWVWQIYPQQEDAHLLKLKALTDQMQATAIIHSDQIEAQTVWNSPWLQPAFWAQWLCSLGAQDKSLHDWWNYLFQQPDLAGQLVRFVTKIG